MGTSGDYKVFVDKLVNGDTPAAASKELEALLHWLAGRENEPARLIQKTFNSYGIPAEVAWRLTLRYLDCTLFAQPHDHYQTLGLSPNSNRSEIRARHKQLLQVFHPDRHRANRDWFTERTEQLNRAYACLRADGAAHRTPHAVPTGQSAPYRVVRRRQRGARTPGLWEQLVTRRHQIRAKLKTHLGSAKHFERRLYVILYSIPATLLLLVALHHLGIPEFREVQINSATEVTKETAGGTKTGFRQHEAAENSKTAVGNDNEKARGEPGSLSVPGSSSEGSHGGSIARSGLVSPASAELRENEETVLDDSYARTHVVACDLRGLPTIWSEDRETYVKKKRSNEGRRSHNRLGHDLQDRKFVAQEFKTLDLYAAGRDERNTSLPMTLCK